MSGQEMYEEWQELEGTYLHIWGGLETGRTLYRKAFADATGRMMQKYSMQMHEIIEIIKQFRHSKDARINELEWCAAEPEALEKMIEGMSPFKLDEF